MMHPSCNIDTNNIFFDPSRVLDDYNHYYHSSSPSFFYNSPSLHHQYIHGDGDNNNIQDELFQDILENHHEMIQQQQNNLENNNDGGSNGDENKGKGVHLDETDKPRKKNSKKDRHTKIDTAQGTRDRRMRLSLNIARKFFELQDMLGFDKASKTVEWLLTQSLPAITELSRNLQQQVGEYSSVSSTSEIAIMDELSPINGNLEKGRPNNKKANQKVVRTIRPLTKESREKARERARERTKEKMSDLQKRRELVGKTADLGNGSYFMGAGCWIPSTDYHNLQQNDAIIHKLTIPELEHLSGNPGVASIW